MMRLFLLIISITAVAFGVIFDGPSDLDTIENTTSIQEDYVTLSEENLRFGGSPRLFFLHLLKYKLNKLQQLEKIPTTPSTHPNCICVPHYYCDQNNFITLDNIDNLDIRYRPCTGNLEVCCYLRFKTPMPSKKTTKKPTDDSTTMPTTKTTTMPTTKTTTMPTTKTTTMPTTKTTTMPTTKTTTMSTTKITTMPTTKTTTMTTTTTTMKPAPPPYINCFCVFPWQCDANGFIIIDGSGINPRQICAVCYQPYSVCCRLNPLGQQIYPQIGFTPIPPIYPTPPTTKPTTLPTLPPVQPTFPTFFAGQTCMCTLITQCSIYGYIPISGAGNIDPRYTSGSLRQMGSSCSKSSEMCCRIGFSSSDSRVFPTNSDYGSQMLKYSETPNACICIKSWNCPENNVVYPEEFENIDSRFGGCPTGDEVCCRLNVISPAASTMKSTITEPENSCGLMSKTFAPAEISSDVPGKSYFAEFPWMVALLLRYPGQNDEFLCGASMINTRVILTAAHCVENRTISNLVARFGEWDTSVTNEPLPFQESKIETVIIHPQFYKAALYHDVAILILKTPVTRSVNVMPICLPQQGQTFAPGTRCYATGWGTNAFEEGQYQDILRKINLPLIDNSDCQNSLRQTKLGQYFQLHGSFICAGGEELADTCKGDGGGPLVCPISTGQYVQIGIVSWGIGCGSKNPAVYASVAQHKLWIDQQLANYGVQ